MDSLDTNEQEKKAWIASYVLIALFFVFVFNQTLFFGANLSVCSHISLVDGCFNSTLRKAPPVIYDPTPYTVLIPNQAVVKTCLTHGQMPLWNDLNACGIPMLGDFAAFVLSPITWIFAFAGQKFYSIVLSLLMLFGALSVLPLAKRLGLTPIPATFSALMFGFCPGVIRYTELPNYHFLLPPIFLSVYSLGAKTFWRSVAAGGICGLSLYVMHAESAFAAVLMSWIFLLVSVLLAARSDWLRALKTYLRSLTVAGLTGLIVAAPIILPFLEFWKNSICYKAVSVNYQVRFAPLPSLLLNLISPCMDGATLFCGSLLIAFIALALMTKHPSAKALALASLIGVWAVARVFPLDILLSHHPFSFFMPIYAAPALILVLSLLAGTGMQSLPQSSFKQRMLAAATLLCSSAVPLVLLAAHTDMNSWVFDHFPVSIDPVTALTQTLISFASALAIIGISSEQSCLKQRSLMQLLIILNLLSFAPVLPNAMPTRKTFWFPKTELLAFLQTARGRILGLQSFLLTPNENAVYGIPDFRTLNCFLPQRYLAFLEQMGGERYELNLFNFDAGKLDKAADMASIKFIIAREPYDQKLSPEHFHLFYFFKDGLKLYANIHALPEAYLANSAIEVKTPEEALSKIKSADFDPWKQITIESDQPLQLPSSPSPVSTAVQIERLSPIKVRLHARGPGVLVLTDSFFPGWTASIDGKETKIFAVNELFRGVKLSPGAHEVNFKYQPLSFKIGILIFMLSSFLLALLGWKQLKSRKKSI